MASPIIRNGFRPANGVNQTPLTGTTQTLAGVAGKRIRILSILYTPASSSTLNIKDGSTTMTGDMTLTGLLLPRIYDSTGQPDAHFMAAVAADVVLVSSNAMSGSVWWTQD